MGMTSDDLKKECQYCYREIDNSGLEGFRCSNRNVIKTRFTSWCYPKCANEPCSICEYYRPKQDMKMPIDEAILYMELYKRNLLDSVSDLDKDIEAYDTVIDTMRKYQKIEQIVNNAKDLDGAVKYNWLYEQIKEVIEDGKID